MKAQQNKMRRSDLDIYLRDGEGFLVRVTPYQEHLEAAHDYKEVSTWKNEGSIRLTVI